MDKRLIAVRLPAETQHARKHTDNKVRFVFVSGYLSTSLPDDLKEVHFLPKPVDASRLKQLAKEFSNAPAKIKRGF
jgi:two-component SAPR family response regulator